MTQRYQITFKQLKNDLTPSQAHSLLQNKLKLSSKLSARFLNGEKVFNPISLEKAQKQQTLFAQLGIHINIQGITETTTAIRNSEVDEKILAALDYITTSLIRLEEKVDELAAQNNETVTLELDEAPEPESWGEELAFDDAPAKRSKLFPYLVATLVILLVGLLAVLLIYPELSPF